MDNNNENQPRRSPFMDMLGQFAQNLTPAQQAAQNDRRLQNCAAYWVSKGLTVQIPDAETLMQKFGEFKRLVRRGTFTVQDIENMTARRYGVIENETVDPELEELNAILREDLSTECDEA